MSRTLQQILQRLEEQLLDPAVRRNTAAVCALLGDKSREVSEIGAVYDRDVALPFLAEEAPHPGVSKILRRRFSVRKQRW